MSPSFRVGMAAMVLAALGSLFWVQSTLQSQVALFQAQLVEFGEASRPPINSSPPVFATSVNPDLQPAPPVILAPPLNAAMARTYLKLQRAIPMPFPQETTLEDALKYIQQATTEPGGEGIPLYVDPVGLTEAEKTMQSPVTIDLKGIPLATCLDLMLKQLGLSYCVQADGLVVITSQTSEDFPVADPGPRVLENLSRLSTEVAALRWEVAVLRTGKAPGPSGGRGPFGGGGVSYWCGNAQ